MSRRDQEPPRSFARATVHGGDRRVRFTSLQTLIASTWSRRQLLSLLRTQEDIESLACHIDDDIHSLASSEPVRPRPPPQTLLY